MSDGPVYLCLDLGGTVIKGGAVRGGTVLARQRAQSHSGDGLRPQLNRLHQMMSALAAEAGLTVAACAGVAIAFPTLVDARAGRLLSPMADKYADAMGVDLHAWAAHDLHLPLRVENDAHAALLGEWRYGAGRGCDDLVMVTLGTGIGTSVILGGRPLRGRHFQAGVLGGHFVMTPDGPPCGCGGRGCVEAEAASAAARRLALADPLFPLSALSRSPVIDFAAVFAAAETGDELATRVRDRCLAYWGCAVVSYIHAYDPQRIILGGGVMRSEALILSKLREFVQERAWTPWGQVELTAAQLGDDAALLGLASAFEPSATAYL